MTNRILLIFMAILAIAGGIFALLNPFAASIAATTIAAWLFLFMGVMQIVAGFRADGIGAKIWTLLLGALAVYLGITILGHPLKGMLALTTMVAILFLASGISKVILSFSLEDKRFFWLILLSGVVSTALGVMILANFPMAAASVLGILLGVELISDGAWALGMAMARDSEEA